MASYRRKRSKTKVLTEGGLSWAAVRSIAKTQRNMPATVQYVVVIANEYLVDRIGPNMPIQRYLLSTVYKMRRRVLFLLDLCRRCNESLRDKLERLIQKNDWQADIEHRLPLVPIERGNDEEVLQRDNVRQLTVSEPRRP